MTLPLSDALQQILDHAVDAYTEEGLDAADIPARRYISPGAPPADCELIAVWGIPRTKDVGALGDPRTTRCAIVHQADITVQSWLCVPTGTPPDEIALDTAGIRVHDHLWAVWHHLARQIVNSTLIAGLACANAQLLNTALVLDEDGAFAGWRIDLRVDLTPLLTGPSAS